MAVSTAFFSLSALLVAVLSFAICAFVLALKNQFPRLSGRPRDLSAVQATHIRHTPRIGGVAVFAAIAFSVSLSPEVITDRYAKFVLAASLLFVVALMEDLGIHVSPRNRLLAAILASLAVVIALDVWIPRTHIPGIDLFIEYWWVGVPITIVATAGISNAFNMIDGVNGLAALTAIVAALAMSQIASMAGYYIMVHLATMMAAAVLGFFLLNYPFGLIFLGDAGAYTLGFVLSWFGVAILLNAPEVSPWALLLTVYWPVADLCLAVWRRVRRNVDAMTPDRLHVHQMVMRASKIVGLARNKSISNPLTTLILFPFLAAPPMVGVLFWDQSHYAFVACLAFSVVLVVSYVTLPLLARSYRRRYTPAPKL